MQVMINNLLGQYVEAIRKIYGEHLQSVILYGSYARGDFRPDSDIDMAWSLSFLYECTKGRGEIIWNYLKREVLVIWYGIVLKRHKDALANFNKDYIKTEIFPRDFGIKIAQAEEICHAIDYDDFYFATKEKAEEQIMVATGSCMTVNEWKTNRKLKMGKLTRLHMYCFA